MLMHEVTSYFNLESRNMACPPLGKALGFDWICSLIRVSIATTPYG